MTERFPSTARRVRTNTVAGCRYTSSADAEAPDEKESAMVHAHLRVVPRAEDHQARLHDDETLSELLESFKQRRKRSTSTPDDDLPTAA